MFEKKSLKFIAIILVPALIYFFYEIYWQRFENIISLNEGSTRVRIAQIFRDIDIMKNNLFFGVGHGNSSQMTEKYINEFSSSLRNYELTYSNTLFEILTGSGFLGFLFALLFFNKILYRNNVLKVLLLLLFLTNGFFLYPILWFFLIFISQNIQHTRIASL